MTLHSRYGSRSHAGIGEHQSVEPRVDIPATRILIAPDKCLRSQSFIRLGLTGTGIGKSGADCFRRRRTSLLLVGSGFSRTTPSGGLLRRQICGQAFVLAGDADDDGEGNRHEDDVQDGEVAQVEREAGANEDHDGLQHVAEPHEE